MFSAGDNMMSLLAVKVSGQACEPGLDLKSSRVGSRPGVDISNSASAAKAGAWRLWRSAVLAEKAPDNRSLTFRPPSSY